MAQQLHTLQNDHWQVGILPGTGASIAYGRVRHNSDWVDVLRPTDEGDYDNPSKCASFIMMPYSNRIRAAQFRFNGQEYQLEANNQAEGVAQHGDVRRRAWQVAEADAQHITLTIDSRDFDDINFPFAFSARAEYRLEDDEFSMGLALKSEDSQPFPAGFGHHPYFVRYGTGASVLLEMPCEQYYEMEASLPTGAAVAIPDYLDFRVLRPLGDHVYNDLLTGRQEALTARIIYPAWKTEIAMYSDPIFEHVILFAPEDKPFFAVEPVTNASDGFNLYEQGVPGTGVFVLQPGATQHGEVRLQVKDT